MRQRQFAPGSARTYRLLGIPAAAEKVIRELFVRHHNGLDSAIEHAEIAMAQRDWPEAVKRWRAIIETHGEKAPVVAYSRLGRAHRLAGDLAGAEPLVRQGLARHGHDVGLAIEHAEIAMAQRDWPEAVKRWRAIIETHGEKAPVVAYSRLGRAHRLAGDLAGAEPLVRQGLARHGHDVGLAIEHAEIAMAQRDWPEAVKRWRAIIETHGEKAPVVAYSRLGRAHRLAGDLAGAEAVTREGLARHSSNAGLAIEHAEIAMARRDWPEAVKRWRAIIEADGLNVPAAAYSRLGRAHRLSGDLEAAEAAIRDGLTRHGSDTSLAIEHAEVAMTQRDWQEAVSRWHAIIEAHREDAPPIVHRRLQEAEKGTAVRIGRPGRPARPNAERGGEQWVSNVDVRYGWDGWVPHQSCRTEHEGRIELLQDFSTPGIRRAVGPVDRSVGSVIFSAEVVAPRAARFLVGVWDDSLSNPLFVKHPVTPLGNGAVEVTIPAEAFAESSWLIFAVTNPAKLRGFHVGRLALRPAAPPPLAVQVWENRAPPEIRRERVRVTAGIASIPSRMTALAQVVDTLIDQVDRLYVYLNGYSSVPEYLQSPKIQPFLSSEFDYRGDAGKFFGLKYESSGVYVTCDDDILYPADYVATLVDALGRHGGRTIVGVHGVLLKQPLADYHELRCRWVFHYRDKLYRDAFVHLVGTGTAAFDLDHVRPRLEIFEYPNMADIWLACFAKANRIPMVAISRQYGWLQDVPDTYSGSIFHKAVTSRCAPHLESTLSTKILRAHEEFTLPATRPRFVFAIKTFNRLEYLRECVNSFVETASHAYNWKVIVTDDGSTDGTKAYLYNLRIPFELHVIHNDRRYAVGQTNTIFQLARKLGFDFGYCVDDDVVFKKSGWERLYYEAALASGYHHLCHFNLSHYRQLASARGLPLEDSPFLDSTGTCEAYVGVYSCMGALFTFTPELLDAVGFADEANFPIRGQWHIDFTGRCARAGFNTVAKCFDAKGANDYVELQNTRISNYRPAVPWDSDEFRRTKAAAELARRDAIVRDVRRVRTDFSPPPLAYPTPKDPGARGETINSFFDQVFVLNLDRRSDRMASIERLLSAFDIDFERFPASDGALPENRQEWLEYTERVAALIAALPSTITSRKEFCGAYESQMDRLRFLAQKGERPPIRSPGAWGYLLSMERLLERMLRDGIDQVLVLDDDIGLLRGTSAIFPAAVRELPNDWRILQLGTMQFDWKDTANYSEHLYCPNGFNFASHAVGMRAEVLPLLLMHTQSKLLPYDVGALNAVHRHYPAGCFCVMPNIAVQDNTESDIGSSEVVAKQTAESLNRRLRWDMDKYVFGADLAVDPDLAVDKLGQKAHLRKSAR